MDWLIYCFEQIQMFWKTISSFHGEFYDRYKTERGRVYIANTRLKKSSIIGFITGVIYWIFTKEFVNYYFRKNNNYKFSIYQIQKRILYKIWTISCKTLKFLERDLTQFFYNVFFLAISKNI